MKTKNNVMKIFICFFAILLMLNMAMLVFCNQINVKASRVNEQAQYYGNTYTFTQVLANGETRTETYLYSDVIQFPVVEKENYNFIGWRAEGAEEFFSLTNMPAYNIKLIAQWELKSNLIEVYRLKQSFSVFFGKDSYELISSIKVYYDSTIELNYIPVNAETGTKSYAYLAINSDWRYDLSKPIHLQFIPKKDMKLILTVEEKGMYRPENAKGKTNIFDRQAVKKLSLDKDGNTIIGGNGGGSSGSTDPSTPEDLPIWLETILKFLGIDENGLKLVSVTLSSINTITSTWLKPFSSNALFLVFDALWRVIVTLAMVVWILLNFLFLAPWWLKIVALVLLIVFGLPIILPVFRLLKKILSKLPVPIQIIIYITLVLVVIIWLVV